MWPSFEAFEGGYRAVLEECNEEALVGAFYGGGWGGCLGSWKVGGCDFSASSMVDLAASPSPVSCFIFRKCEKQV